MDESGSDGTCQQPLTLRHLPTLLFGKLAPIAIIATRNGAGEPRWGVVGLYSSSDDDPAVCVFRPARVADIGRPGCVALDAAGEKRTFPEIGPFTVSMAWPLALRLATPRESQLWTHSLEHTA